MIEKDLKPNKISWNEFLLRRQAKPFWICLGLLFIIGFVGVRSCKNSSHQFPWMDESEPVARRLDLFEKRLFEDARAEVETFNSRAYSDAGEMIKLGFNPSQALNELKVQHEHERLHLLPLMILRDNDPVKYAEMPAEEKAEILFSALTSCTFHNQFGLPGWEDEDVMKAIRELPIEVISKYNGLLNNRKPLRFYGGIIRKESIDGQFRICDYMLDLITKKWTLLEKQDSSSRNMVINSILMTTKSYDPSAGSASESSGGGEEPPVEGPTKTDKGDGKQPIDGPAKSDKDGEKLPEGGQINFIGNSKGEPSKDRFEFKNGGEKPPLESPKGSDIEDKISPLKDPPKTPEQNGKPAPKDFPKPSGSKPPVPTNKFPTPRDTSKKK